MQQGQASVTALGAAGHRAAHQVLERGFVFADPLALRILGEDADNAIALANLRLNRWFGWSGAADSLWAQSLRPILDERELGASAELVHERLAADSGVVAAYARIFCSALASDAPELVPALLAACRARKIDLMLPEP